MAALRKLAGQTAIYGISSVLGRILNMFLTPLYTYVFRQNVGLYGVVTFFYSGITFINVLLTFGMETTFFRFIQDSEEPKKVYDQAFFWVSLMAGGFLVICLSMPEAIAGTLGYPEYPELVQLMGGFVFLDMIAALPLAKLRHEEKTIRFATINLINVLVGMTANFIFLIGLDKGITYIFVANLIASAVRTSLALWGNLPSRMRPEWSTLKPMLHYGFFIMIAGLAGTVNETVDRLMIPWRWGDGTLFEGIARTGEEMNGIYGANYKVAMLIVLFTQAYRYAAEPFFFREARSEKSPETFARVFHYFTLTTLTGFLVLSSFTREIVSFDLTFGLFSFSPKTFIHEQFWEGMSVVPILLLAYVFSAAYINISIWFKITKQTRFAILFTGTGALITILFNYFGIPRFGFQASAWATLVCYLIMTVMVYRLGQRYYPIPYRIGRILGYGVLFVLAYFFNRSIGPTDGFAPAFLMKAGSCLLVLALVYLGERYYPVFGPGRKT